jgi:LCP family protein required for cell wall assembly
MLDSASPITPVPRVCPRCGEVIGQRDKFCPMCGTDLDLAFSSLAPKSRSLDVTSTDGDRAENVVPLPGLSGESTISRKSQNTKKRLWYQRPLYLIPLMLLLLLGVIVSVLAWRTRAALDDVHSVSTPPPEVAASSLGGSHDLAIDTGPAQAAIADREGPARTTRANTMPPVTESSGAVVAPTPPEPQSPEVPSLSPDTDGSPFPVGSTPVSTADASSEASTPPSAELGIEGSQGLTVLLMGVDSREGEAIDIGVRPDSLAILHIDQQTGSCRMLAVPRDSRAKLPGYGYSKINHALAIAGIPYQMLVVEEYLGLEVDNYALIDFAGVETVVDTLGGITVENPAAFVMADESFAAGTLQLNGEQALLYSRFRGDDQGDFGRISRQQQVLRAMLDQATDVNVVTSLPSMFTSLSNHFRTDFGVGDLVDVANDYRHDCTAESIETRTIPGVSTMEYDELMQQDLSFVVSDPTDVQQDVAWLLGQTDEEPIDEGPARPVAVIPGELQRTTQTRWRHVRWI